MELSKSKNMKAALLILIVLMIGNTQLQAQQFIDKAVIEYEVKTNVKKTMGNSSWDEMLKEAMGQFKTAYFQYSFADNKSVYKFDRWATGQKIPEWFRKNDEDNIWYFDHTGNKFTMQKTLYGSPFIAEDSIPVINWKIANESRVIAGFNCRKAEGVINDSVYVFAFYTDEIMISGGPCSISGLPGMILGLTIPRMYTSWIATKVSVNNVSMNNIKAPTTKKPFTLKSFETNISERTKDWFRYGSDAEEAKKEKQQFMWGVML